MGSKGKIKCKKEKWTQYIGYRFRNRYELIGKGKGKCNLKVWKRDRGRYIKLEKEKNVLGYREKNKIKCTIKNTGVKR